MKNCSIRVRKAISPWIQPSVEAPSALVRAPSLGNMSPFFLTELFRFSHIQ